MRNHEKILFGTALFGTDVEARCPPVHVNGKKPAKSDADARFNINREQSHLKRMLKRRDGALDAAADGAIVMGYHYGTPGAGRIARDGNGHAFTLLA